MCREGDTPDTVADDDAIFAEIMCDGTLEDLLTGDDCSGKFLAGEVRFTRGGDIIALVDPRLSGLVFLSLLVVDVDLLVFERTEFPDLERGTCRVNEGIELLRFCDGGVDCCCSLEGSGAG